MAFEAHDIESLNFYGVTEIRFIEFIICYFNSILIKDSSLRNVGFIDIRLDCLQLEVYYLIFDFSLHSLFIYFIQRHQNSFKF